MKLLELQEKNDEELLDFAVEEGAVEDGATPRRMDILRKMFKVYSDKEFQEYSTKSLSKQVTLFSIECAIVILSCLINKSCI